MNRERNQHYGGPNKFGMEKERTPFLGHPMTKVASLRRRTSRKTITEALAADHAAARAAIARILADPRRAPEIYPGLADALRRHSAAEEATLYTALDAFPVEQPEMARSWHEHDQIGQLLNVLDTMPYGRQWMDAFMRMNAALEHHLGIEETRVFAAADRLLPHVRRVTLARRYEQAMHGTIRNVSIMLPSIARVTVRNPCGCSGSKRNPSQRWWHPFTGVLRFIVK